jgi:hypothetical protein
MITKNDTFLAIVQFCLKKNIGVSNVFWGWQQVASLT